jgi:serine/threonine protein kinase
MSVPTALASGKTVTVREYTLIKQIGAGSFGDIFLAKHNTQHNLVAIKMEKTSSQHPQLNHEYKIYKIIKSNSGKIHKCESVID